MGTLSLAAFLKGLPERLFELDEELFRDHSLKLAEPELQALVDLALEGALARRAQGEEITPMMVSAMVRLQKAVDAADAKGEKEPSLWSREVSLTPEGGDERAVPSERAPPMGRGGVL